MEETRRNIFGLTPLPEKNMLIKNLMNIFASGYIGEDENGEYYDPELAMKQIEEVKILDSEVQTLVEEEFGGFLPICGSVEIELHRLLEILPRKRKKADAYKGLISKLRNEYGLNLVIVSTRKKKEANDEKREIK